MLLPAASGDLQVLPGPCEVTQIKVVPPLTMLHLTMSCLYPITFQKARLQKLGDGQLGDGGKDPGDRPIMDWSAQGPQDLFKSHRHRDTLPNNSRDHFSSTNGKSSPHAALGPAL